MSTDRPGLTVSRQPEVASKRTSAPAVRARVATRACVNLRRDRSANASPDLRGERVSVVPSIFSFPLTCRPVADWYIRMRPHSSLVRAGPLGILERPVLAGDSVGFRPDRTLGSVENAAQPRPNPNGACLDTSDIATPFCCFV